LSIVQITLNKTEPQETNYIRRILNNENKKRNNQKKFLINFNEKILIQVYIFMYACTYR
jgi:hypothetical protein